MKGISRKNMGPIRAQRKPRRSSNFMDKTTYTSGSEPLTLVSTISGSAVVNRYDFELANSSNLPRLTTVAKGWSVYRWVKLRIRFKSFAPSTVSGRIALCATYDPDSDTAPTTVNQLLRSQPSCTSSVWKDMVLEIPCGINEFKENWYPYTAVGGDTNVPVSLYIATDNAGASINVGEVYVDYKIAFRHPIDEAVNT